MHDSCLSPRRNSHGVFVLFCSLVVLRTSVHIPPLIFPSPLVLLCQHSQSSPPCPSAISLSTIVLAAALADDRPESVSRRLILAPPSAHFLVPPLQHRPWSVVFASASKPRPPELHPHFSPILTCCPLSLAHHPRRIRALNNLHSFLAIHKSHSFLKTNTYPNLHLTSPFPPSS